MTKPKSVCNQQAMRFLTAFLVPHPETTESGVSRRWEEEEAHVCGSRSRKIQRQGPLAG
jgi:hypothetical protein